MVKNDSFDKHPKEHGRLAILNQRVEKLTKNRLKKNQKKLQSKSQYVGEPYVNRIKESFFTASNIVLAVLRKRKLLFSFYS